jgi:hypothetical protein
MNFLEDGIVRKIPDEALPALAIMTLYYRDRNALIKEKVIKNKRNIHSELSTVLSSPIFKAGKAIECDLFDDFDLDISQEKENIISTLEHSPTKKSKLAKSERDFENENKSESKKLHSNIMEQVCHVLLRISTVSMLITMVL